IIPPVLERRFRPLRQRPQRHAAPAGPFAPLPSSSAGQPPRACGCMVPPRRGFPMAGPIEQFEIKPIVPLEMGGIDLSFTNASAYMVLTVGVAGAFLLLATGRRGLVPGRWQSAAEMVTEFVATTLRSNAGEKGMRFFPLVFS